MRLCRGLRTARKHGEHAVLGGTHAERQRRRFAAAASGDLISMRRHRQSSAAQSTDEDLACQHGTSARPRGSAETRGKKRNQKVAMRTTLRGEPQVLHVTPAALVSASRFEVTTVTTRARESRREPGGHDASQRVTTRASRSRREPGCHDASQAVTTRARMSRREPGGHDASQRVTTRARRSRREPGCHDA
jgi:hypothetical protein